MLLGVNNTSKKTFSFKFQSENIYKHIKKSAENTTNERSLIFRL